MLTRPTFFPWAPFFLGMYMHQLLVKLYCRVFDPSLFVFLDLRLIRYPLNFRRACGQLRLRRGQSNGMQQAFPLTALISCGSGPLKRRHRQRRHTKRILPLM